MKLSDYCKSEFNISNRAFKYYLKNKKIKINDKIINRNIDITTNDNILLEISNPDLSYDIKNYFITKNNYVVFLYKPPFIHSERLKPDDNLTMQDIFFNEFPEFRMITRLDYETDGIIAAVKKDYKIIKMKKTYLAMVNGVIDKEIIIKNKIDASNRKKVKVLDEYQKNTTLIMPYETYENHSIVKVELKLATRHQIRAYLASLNYPILGDNLYGNNENTRLKLHCWKNEINNTICESNKDKLFLDECMEYINKI